MTRRSDDLKPGVLSDSLKSSLLPNHSFIGCHERQYIIVEIMPLTFPGSIYSDQFLCQEPYKIISQFLECRGISPVPYFPIGRGSPGYLDLGYVWNFINAHKDLIYSIAKHVPILIEIGTGLKARRERSEALRAQAFLDNERLKVQVSLPFPLNGYFGYRSLTYLKDMILLLPDLSRCLEEALPFIDFVLSANLLPEDSLINNRVFVAFESRPTPQLCATALKRVEKHCVKHGLKEIKLWMK